MLQSKKEKGWLMNWKRKKVACGVRNGWTKWVRGGAKRRIAANAAARKARRGPSLFY